MNDLLPNNSTPLERALSLTTARVSDVPVPARDLWNPDTCPVHLLPWLAWTLSVEAWDPQWPEHLKRSVISNAIKIAKTKGTKRSVVDALNAIGASVVLTEWFEVDPPLPPHTFTIDIVGNTSTTAMQDLIVREINRTKPLRSHYAVNFGAEFEGSVNVVGVLRPVVFLRISGSSAFAPGIYHRPDGTSEYLQPDGASQYLR